MKLVFEVPLKDKAKLLAILEADPYGEVSFSRNGYKIKEGSVIGLDKGKAYLYISCSEEFAKFARAKLSGIAAECSPEVSSAVAKAIEEEENNAEVGFGSIFG
ncbi:MAG: hypothetical protein N3G22_04625 [Candidatus Micrarchaeota archaeon]|nr:hypothetical protein [Candidatus Micrarchaeota archaeon]